MGDNSGLGQEPKLRYAATDASKIAELFRSASAFPKTEVTVLTDVDVAGLRAGLARVRARAAALKRAGATVAFVFFYSGHGSARSLHLAGGEFPRAELQELYTAGEFDVRILILDACESGDFLRRKGAPEPAHDFSVSDGMEARGTMVLSASARGELAQESEEYKEGVFSHHLMNALRGLGDFNGDSRVSVLEAFEYAQTSTRGERIVGRTNMQNPEFDLDLVGRNDIALVDLAGAKANLILEDFPFGEAGIYDAYSYRLVESVRFTGKKRVSYMMRPGNYVLSFRNAERSGYCSFTLSPAEPCRVRVSDARTVPRGGGRSKGAFPIPVLRHQFRSSVQWGVPARETNPTSIELAYLYSLMPGLETGLKFGIGRNRETAADGLLGIENTGYLWEAVAGAPLWQLRRLGLWCGFGIGALFLDQRIRDRRLFAGPIESENGTLEPVRQNHAVVLQTHIPLSIRFRLFPGLFVSADLGWNLRAYRKANRDGYSAAQGWERGVSLGVQM